MVHARDINYTSCEVTKRESRAGVILSQSEVFDEPFPEIRVARLEKREENSRYVYLLGGGTKSKTVIAYYAAIFSFVSVIGSRRLAHVGRRHDSLLHMSFRGGAHRAFDITCVQLAPGGVQIRVPWQL